MPILRLRCSPLPDRASHFQRLVPSTPGRPTGRCRQPHVLQPDCGGALERARAEADARLGPSVAWSEELSRWSLLLWAGDLVVMSSSREGLVERCRAFEAALAEPQIRAGPLQAVQALRVLGVSLDHEESTHGAGTPAPGHENMGQVAPPLDYQRSACGALRPPDVRHSCCTGRPPRAPSKWLADTMVSAEET